ncbi:MAG TPA: hypothetical protein VND22_00020 [Actinomycetota bacterium]|nr:hypothetical protein [Actinomycetota bacterium]
MSSAKKKTDLKRKRTAFEWAIGIVAAACITTMVGGLVYYGFTAGTGPPDLAATITPEGEGKYTLTVTNKGGTTAEDVVVEVTSGEDVQEVQFLAVAKGHKEEATVIFEEAGQQPEAKVLTFKEP